jgi:hypothetical protein
MRFDHFQSFCRSSWQDWDNPEKLQRALHPIQRHLRELPALIPGMATENKILLLNNAVAALEEDEVYVEVGCWQGLTLIGAMKGNSTKQAFACDNFSQFGGPRKALARHLQQNLSSNLVSFFDMDFQSFLRQAPWAPKKIGVYFYDGDHNFAAQYRALELAVPHLAQEALVIIDDTNGAAVRRANSIIREEFPGLQCILNIRTPCNGHPSWWNGVQVFLYRSGASRTRWPRFRLSAERVFWDYGVASASRVYSSLKHSLLSLPLIGGIARQWRARGSVR